METKASKEELVEYLATHSRYEAAKHFRLGYTNFIAHLKYYGIEEMGAKRKTGPRKAVPSKKQLVAYLRTHTFKECKEHFGLGEWAFARCLDAYDIQQLAPSSFPVKCPSRKVLREYLRTHTVCQAVKHFGVNRSTVKKWRARFKIAYRPVNTVTLTEAAEILQVSKVAVSVWCKKGLVSGIITNGRYIFIPKDEVKRLLSCRNGENNA